MTNETAKWNGRGIEIRNGANIIVENCTFPKWKFWSLFIRNTWKYNSPQL